MADDVRTWLRRPGKVTLLVLAVLVGVLLSQLVLRPLVGR